MRELLAFVQKLEQAAHIHAPRLESEFAQLHDDLCDLHIELIKNPQPNGFTAGVDSLVTYLQQWQQKFAAHLSGDLNNPLLGMALNSNTLQTGLKQVQDLVAGLKHNVELNQKYNTLVDAEAQALRAEHAGLAQDDAAALKAYQTKEENFRQKKLAYDQYLAKKDAIVKAMRAKQNLGQGLPVEEVRQLNQAQTQLLQQSYPGSVKQELPVTPAAQTQPAAKEKESMFSGLGDIFKALIMLVFGVFVNFIKKFLDKDTAEKIDGVTSAVTQGVLSGLGRNTGSATPAPAPSTQPDHDVDSDVDSEINDADFVDAEDLDNDSDNDDESDNDADVGPYYDAEPMIFSDGLQGHGPAQARPDASIRAATPTPRPSPSRR